MRHRNSSLPELRKACSGLGKSGWKEIERAHEFMQKNSESKALKAHQRNTAFTLARLGFDASTVSAALVHEVLFDAPEKKKEMEEALGKEITGIAEDSARLKSVEKKNFGKMPNPKLSKVIMGIAKDFRSLFVELASHLDKMRDLGHRHQEKRPGLAEIARDVHAPIAHKLGLYDMEWEMLDLALKYFKPASYEKIRKLVGKKRHVRESVVKSVEKSVREILAAEKISASVTGRAKSFHGIYEKMEEQGKKFSEISDLLGVRVICGSVEDCYRVTGLIHMNFRSFGEYDDYIASPKKNNYQSIHTAFGWKGEKVEAQIRTWEMHRNAEEGLAAHWRYKQLEKDTDFDQRLTWVKQLVEWQRKLKKNSESMRSLKLGFSDREVFVLTPKKEIVMLHEGATALDFAFAVHSDLGTKCKSVIINGKIAQLGAPLESGDVVLVNVSSKQECKPAWLNIVKSEKAKARIRKCFGIKSSGKEKTKAKKTRTTEALKKMAIAKCCSPIPGDSIVGYRTTKRKTTIHSKDCQFLALLPDERKAKIEWGGGGKERYSSKLKVRALERAGILIDLLNELEKQGVAINGTETKSERGQTLKCEFDIELKNAAQFERVQKSMMSIPAVIEVGR